MTLFVKLLLIASKQTFVLKPTVDIFCYTFRSFVRFPKWAHTFENILTFDFKTKQKFALLFYTDDEGRYGNYYEAIITDAHLKLTFRLGTDIRNHQVLSV